MPSRLDSMVKPKAVGLGRGGRRGQHSRRHEPTWLVDFLAFGNHGIPHLFDSLERNHYKMLKKFTLSVEYPRVSSRPFRGSFVGRARVRVYRRDRLGCLRFGTPMARAWAETWPRSTDWCPARQAQEAA